MARWIAILLIVLLCLSLAINAYLWTALQSNGVEETAQSTSASLRNDNTSRERAQAIASKTNIDTGVTSTIVHDNALSLEDLLSSRQFDRLAQELSIALKKSPFDERLLLLEAEMIRLTKPLSVALVHLYDLAELPLSTELLDKVNKQIVSLYQQAQNQLSRDRQWELLAKLNEPLFQRVPESREYALNLALAYAHQKKRTLMEDALAPLPFEDEDAQAIRTLAYRAPQKSYDDNTSQEDGLNDEDWNATGARETRVAMLRVGDQYRLNIKALNQKAMMILDTGASTTAISSRLYARLGKNRRLTFIGNFNVRTASGTIEAPLVKIPRFYFAGYEFNDVSAIVLPEEALPDTDGLLGMNILGEFDFSIMPQSSELRLVKRT